MVAEASGIQFQWPRLRLEGRAARRRRNPSRDAGPRDFLVLTDRWALVQVATRSVVAGTTRSRVTLATGASIDRASGSAVWRRCSAPIVATRGRWAGRAAVPRTARSYVARFPGRDVTGSARSVVSRSARTTIGGAAGPRVARSPGARVSLAVTRVVRMGGDDDADGGGQSNQCKQSLEHRHSPGAIGRPTRMSRQPTRPDDSDPSTSGDHFGVYPFTPTRSTKALVAPKR